MTSPVAKLKNTNIISGWFIFIIVLNLAVSAALVCFNNHPNSFTHFKWLSTTKSPNWDSWKAMHYAISHIKESPDDLIYQELLIKRGIKFQYLPTSLLIFDIPQQVTGLSYYQVGRILDIISFVSIFVAVLVCSKILRILLSRYHFEASYIPKRPIYQHLLILALTVLFYPLIFSFHIGQIQTLLTCLTSIALLLWIKDKRAFCGVLLGFICLVKPQLGLVFVWGIIRRQWNMVIGGGIVICIGLLTSIALYGFDNHMDYLAALSFLSKHGEAYFPNQSINGLMNRLLFNGDNLTWQPNAFPPYSPVVYFTTLISSLIIITTGLLWNYKKNTPNVVDLCLMLLCSIIASPIAWEHHYGVILPIFIILSPFSCLFYRNKKWKLLLLAIAYLLVSINFNFLNVFAGTWLNIFQSYLFFGALLFLFFCLQLSKKLNMESNLNLIRNGNK
ncbi:glycosyltransferase family 87 protein [Parapedobacter sp. DT-150]